MLDSTVPVKNELEGKCAALEQEVRVSRCPRPRPRRRTRFPTVVPSPYVCLHAVGVLQTRVTSCRQTVLSSFPCPAANISPFAPANACVLLTR